MITRIVHHSLDFWVLEILHKSTGIQFKTFYTFVHIIFFTQYCFTCLQIFMQPNSQIPRRISQVYEIFHLNLYFGGWHWNCWVWKQLSNMFWDAKLSLLGGKHLSIAMFWLHNLFWWLIYLDMFVLKHAALTHRIGLTANNWDDDYKRGHLLPFNSVFSAISSVFLDTSPTVAPWVAFISFPRQ